MKSSTIPQRRFDWAMLWLLGGAVVWAMVPIVFGNQTLRTYRDIAAALPGYLLVGLLVGAATGLAQALAWRLPGPAARR